MKDNMIEILLVEDTASDAELAIYTLEKNRLAVQLKLVRDGAEALDFLFNEGVHANSSEERPSPRVIWLDLKLPKIEGKEVLRRIKSDPRTRDIPVVVLTSSHEDRDLRTAYDLGANSYVVKPVDFKEFGEVVRQLGVYWLELNERPTSLGA
jgi:two-component system response regulator